MKNSKKFALTAVMLSLLVGCSTAPTDDTTVIEETTVHGFLLLGRVEGAEAVGCSMAVDEFLKATAGC